MANIQNYLNQIKTAVFGKDVRESIHNAIKQCYDDAAVNHDNANMEVKLARGSYNTLNDRLDENEKVQENFSSQLDNNTNKLDNFTFDNVDVPLIGQGVPTDVSILMKKNFNNDKRQYAFGVEINADGSNGSHNVETASGHKVAIYSSAHTGTNGKPYIWSFNTLAQADSGLKQNAMIQGYELDVNNNQSDTYRNFIWDNGVCLGLNITSGGLYPITCGARIGGTNNTNLPNYGLILDGSQESALQIENTNGKGIDMRNATFTSDYAIVLNKNHKVGVYDNTTNNYNTVLRFLNDYTILSTQGGGFMITTKDGSKMLFEVKEDGTVNAPSKITTARLECPVISTGQGEIRPTLSGDSGLYPSNPLIGQCYFDRTRGIPLWFNGVGWVNAQGNLPT